MGKYLKICIKLDISTIHFLQILVCCFLIVFFENTFSTADDNNEDGNDDDEEEDKLESSYIFTSM